MTTPSTKTQPITIFFNLITLSVPVLHPTFIGLRTASRIASSAIVEELFFYMSVATEFLRRMAGYFKFKKYYNSLCT